MYINRQTDNTRQHKTTQRQHKTTDLSPYLRRKLKENLNSHQRRFIKVKKYLMMSLLHLEKKLPMLG